MNHHHDHPHQPSQGLLIVFLLASYLPLTWVDYSIEVCFTHPPCLTSEIAPWRVKSWGCTQSSWASELLCAKLESHPAVSLHELITGSSITSDNSLGHKWLQSYPIKSGPIFRSRVLPVLEAAQLSGGLFFAVSCTDSLCSTSGCPAILLVAVSIMGLSV